MPTMEFDEYDYLERTVEDPVPLTDKDRRSSGGDAGDSRSSRRPKSEERNGGRNDRERNGGRDDRERNSGREDRERSSSRHHRSSRDGDRDRDRRSRERGHDEHHRRSSRDEERARSKDVDRRRSRDYEKDKERAERERRRRSSSRHEREVEVERERERERGRAKSRERAERERELELMERERRRFKEKKEQMEPEADPERDQRTVFAYQMPLKATERDVYEFFSQVGKVRDVRLIMDRNSRRSKGVGYIEFYDAMSVPHAITLCGHLFLGQPVMVKPSEAEKNLVQSNSAVGPGVTGAASDRKLYVGNLHYNINEVLLRQIFEAFGPVELVQLPLDPDTGHCKGYGFVQFAQLEHAKAARNLNGTLEVAGRTIKVSAVTDHVGGQNVGTNTADFDDDDGTGLEFVVLLFFPRRAST